jgi:secreted PhoX family phosphatase
VIKKLFYCGVLALVCFVTGCVTTKPKQMEFTLPGEASSDYSVTVLNYRQFGDSLYERANPDRFINGFTINVKNNSRSIIKIIWDNSSITDENGTHRLFLDGQKYVDANKSIPPQVIPPGGNITKAVFSADNIEYVSYGRTWRINPMKGHNFTLTICVENNGTEDYAIISVSVKDAV